ncbi:MAG: YraN family protein [Alphaproteobacteria bacterium]|nr:YraN family protein [Alphaproteobacteria bacterium]
MARPDRRRHEARGRLAEAFAAGLLAAKGYAILATRVRNAAGEIDLVAKRGRTLVFVEVKLRADIALAGESILARQRGRIARAAALFLKARPDLQCLDARFDAILLVPWRLPRHVAHAWDAS